MSDIPRARDLIQTVLSNYPLPGGAAASLRKAVTLMVRRAPTKRAAAVRPRITGAVRAEVRRLASLGMSHHEIAQQLDLRNGGRVSEILNGDR